MRSLGSTLVLLFLPLIASQSSSQTLLWEVRGEGFRTPSYLFGTIHAICPETMSVPDTLTRLLLASERVALELDMDDPAVSTTMAQEAFMPGDTTLLDLLDSLEYHRLSRFFTDSIGMRLEPMKYIKPLFFVGMMMKRLLGCDPTSYERVFSTLARQNGRAILGIETAREQLDVFSSIPLRRQAQMVLDMVDSLDACRRELADLQLLFLSGDIQALHTLVTRTNIEYGRYDTEVLRMRNRRWVPRIITLMNEAPTFIAVGAGHLGGEEGLIALLRAKGYSVSPIPLPLGKL